MYYSDYVTIAIVTLTFTFWSNPSIWLSSSNNILCTSRSAIATSIATVMHGLFIYLVNYTSMCVITDSLRQYLKYNQYLPPVCASNLFVAMASISSINIIAGAFSLANRNTSLTIRGPSPKYFCTNSDPTTLMKAAVV